MNRTTDWGDHRLLKMVFQDCRGRIVSAMDAGDNVLELLHLSDEFVDVISPSTAEHSLLWLKWQSMNHFHPDRRLNLLGIHPGGRRIFEYHHLRPLLPQFAQEWWDLHEGKIREGLVGSGVEELSYQQWWNRLERWVGRWPVELSLNEHQQFVSQLFERPRWRLFQRLNSEVWFTTWKRQIQHQLLKGLYWEPIQCRTWNSYQQAPRTLHPDGEAKEPSAQWTLHHTSMLEHLREQSPNSVAGVNLGEHLKWGEELGHAVLRVLKNDAPIFLWQHSKPSDLPGLHWQEITTDYTGFLAGRPWIAFKGSA